MELNRVDARALICLEDAYFDGMLCKALNDYEIVSDFFKQERLKCVNVIKDSNHLFGHKITPFFVAMVAIAYQYSDLSSNSVSASAAVANFALNIFTPFVFFRAERFME